MPSINSPAGPIYYSPSVPSTPVAGTPIDPFTGSAFLSPSQGVTALQTGPGTPAGDVVSTNPITGVSSNVNISTAQGQQAYEETLALQGQAVTNLSNAAAQNVIQQGDTAEATAYQTAAGISGSNASLALQSSQLEAYQESIQALQTIGGQQADVAASGFANAGSSLSLLKSSVRQAALTQGMTQLQGNITAGGFYAQQAASNAEVLAAQTASNAAASLASSDAAAGTLALSNSTNLTNALANPATSVGFKVVGEGGAGSSVDPFGQFANSGTNLPNTPSPTIPTAAGTPIISPGGKLSTIDSAAAAVTQPAGFGPGSPGYLDPLYSVGG